MKTRMPCIASVQRLGFFTTSSGWAYSVRPTRKAYNSEFSTATPGEERVKASKLLTSDKRAGQMICNITPF
jgi:hypothetical protein